MTNYLNPIMVSKIEKKAKKLVAKWDVKYWQAVMMVAAIETKISSGMSYQDDGIIVNGWNNSNCDVEKAWQGFFRLEAGCFDAANWLMLLCQADDKLAFVENNPQTGFVWEVTKKVKGFIGWSQFATEKLALEFAETLQNTRTIVITHRPRWNEYRVTVTSTCKLKGLQVIDKGRV